MWNRIFTPHDHTHSLTSSRIAIHLFRYVFTYPQTILICNCDTASVYIYIWIYVYVRMGVFKCTSHIVTIQTVDDRDALTIRSRHTPQGLSIMHNNTHSTIWVRAILLLCERWVLDLLKVKQGKTFLYTPFCQRTICQLILQKMT